MTTDAIMIMAGFILVGIGLDLETATIGLLGLGFLLIGIGNASLKYK